MLSLAAAAFQAEHDSVREDYRRSEVVVDGSCNEQGQQISLGPHASV